MEIRELKKCLEEYDQELQIDVADHEPFLLVYDRLKTRVVDRIGVGD